MRRPPTGQFAQPLKQYSRISALPLTSAMGAEIRDVDLSNIKDGQFAEIEDALFRYKMIFFRDQDISHADQESVTSLFGEFATDAYTTGIEGHLNIQGVVKEAEDRPGMVFGGGWHTDSPFLQQPPAISMLHGVDIPPYGGDTWWANTELAYTFLSDTMKAVLQPLYVHMSASTVMVRLDQETAKSGTRNIGAMALSMDEQAMVKGAYHPLVRTHPRTGSKSLYIDGVYSEGIKGMTPEEAAPLMKFLLEHITQPEFICRLRWEKNSFVMWDNRICLHHAINDYDGFRREMFRSTVAGETPS